eukprot:5289571-Amphidinium_carterae.1
MAHNSVYNALYSLRALCTIGYCASLDNVCLKQCDNAQSRVTMKDYLPMTVDSFVQYPPSFDNLGLGIVAAGLLKADTHR